MNITLTVNGKTSTIDVDRDTPLLWILREHMGLTGTKYGCGIGECGSCTIHMNGEPVKSCDRAVGEISERGNRHDRGSRRQWSPSGAAGFHRR